jgi:hypothetical protein
MTTRRLVLRVRVELYLHTPIYSAFMAWGGNTVPFTLTVFSCSWSSYYFAVETMANQRLAHINLGCTVSRALIRILFFSVRTVKNTWWFIKLKIQWVRFLHVLRFLRDEKSTESFLKRVAKEGLIMKELLQEQRALRMLQNVDGKYT